MRVDDQQLIALFPQLLEIGSEPLRRQVIDVWIDVAAECAWERLEDAPKNVGHERHRRLIDHISGVTSMAMALGEIVARDQKLAVDRDVLIAACLLHDISKFIENEPDPDGAPTNGPTKPGRHSAIGKKIQHPVYGVHKVLAHNLPLEVVHLVATHSPSTLRPTSLEAALLFYADYTDSDAAIIGAGGPPFLARWKLGAE